MKRQELIYNIVYYVALFTILWLMSRDGPPLRVVFWYHLYRTSQTVARVAGRVGLDAEHTYHVELEKTRI